MDTLRGVVAGRTLARFQVAPGRLVLADVCCDFETIYRGTTLRPEEPRIRFIRPDVATIEGFSTVVSAGVERRAHMLAVAARGEDGWSLRALHNMIPFAPPA